MKDGSRRYTAEVDLTAASPLPRIWRYIGYDEPNYSCTSAGRELLAKIGALPDSPYYIRTHFLLCSGDGVGRLKWGSTNVCTLGDDGRMLFDWSIWDRIFDAHLESGCIPFVEIGFMPEALSSAPPGIRYDDEREGGWRFPPADFKLWGDLVAEVARHSMARYGSRSVSRWYWELWNEPDIFYWAGTPEEYFRLFDVTEAALHSVIPFARLGGPATTNPASEGGGRFLRAFLDHCAAGTRLDFITFHAKGGRFNRDPDAAKATPTIETLISNVRVGLEIVGDFAAFRDLEIVLSECDPDGWAAGSRRDNPNLDYRNSEYYASYLATSVCRLLDLADERGPRVDGMLSWAFEFENRAYFEGFRTLSTNGIDKPVFGSFKLLSRLGGRRAAFRVSTPDEAVAAPLRLSGIATIGPDGQARILLVHHDDDWDARVPADVTVELRGLPKRTSSVHVEELILDSERSNTYTAWKGMGSPEAPTEEERGRLVDAQGLFKEERSLAASSAHCAIAVHMRSHAVHLLTVTPQ